MDIKTENTCRLCLHSYSDCNVETIGRIAVESLNLLFLNLNLNVSEEPAMCGTCSDFLKKCFDFKNNCLTIEDSIKRFVDRKSEITLAEVYKVVKGDLALTNIEDKQICRFCFNVVANNFKLLKEDGIIDMVQEYIPELNVNISLDPILCGTCIDMFRNYVAFVSSCSNVENEIIKYIDAVGHGLNGYVNLAEVSRFAQQNLDNITNFKAAEKMPIKVENIKTEGLQEEYFVPVNCGDMTVSKLNKDEGAYMETFPNQKCEYKEKVDSANFSSLHTEFVLSDIKKERYDTVEEDDNFNTKAMTEMKWKPQDPNGFEPSSLAKYEATTLLDASEPQPGPISTPDYFSPHFMVDGGKDEALNQSQKETTVSNVWVLIDEKYKCDTCSYQTKYEAFLTRHMQKHRDRSTTQKKDTKKVPTEQSSRPNAPILKCEFCEYETTRKYRLREHGLTHMDPSEVQIFTCDHCDFKTKWKNTLRKHSLRHKNTTEVLMYSCDFCEYSSKSRSYLFQHSLVHKNGPAHKCDKCNYETKYKSYFTRHLLTHKNALEIHKCPDCQFKTYSEASLSRHRVKHGEASKLYSFKCEICGYSSSRRFRLKEHMITHKDLADVHIYKCDRCPFQTKWRCTFNKHRLVHDESYQRQVYSCEFCDFKSTSKDYLNKHTIAHKDPSQIVIHQCEVCGFQTKTKHYLKSHMLSHIDLAKIGKEGGVVNGERVQVFECDQCGYKAKRKMQLVKHMVRHRV